MTIYPSRIKLGLLFLGSCAFVLAGFSISRQHIDSWKAIVGTWVGIPFFSLCGIYFLFRLVCLRPSLHIDATGIFDNSTLFAVGLMHWSDIQDIRVYNFRNELFVGINPTDTFRQRLPRYVRSIMRVNEWLSCMPINIPTATLRESLDEVMAAIEEHMPKQIDSR